MLSLGLAHFWCWAELPFSDCVDLLPLCGILACAYHCLCLPVRASAMGVAGMTIGVPVFDTEKWWLLKLVITTYTRVPYEPS